MKTLHTLTRADEHLLQKLDTHTCSKLHVSGIQEQIIEDIQQGVAKQLAILGLSKTAPSTEVFEAMFQHIENDEERLYEYVGIDRENIDFQKIITCAKKIGGTQYGFFLKKECARAILEQCPPLATMKHLGYSSVQAMLQKEDSIDIFSALRFTESTEWMHQTFDAMYPSFTKDDFERREVEIRVLGTQWKDAVAQFIKKKHHNVSHLKEFGVIFMNPVAESTKGKFLRDFALLLHYTHEILFYSKLFENSIGGEHFNDQFLSLLRGDVPDQPALFEPSEWLIIQRYLWKDDPYDKRLFIPRVNPESLHWRKAQQDLVALAKNNNIDGFSLWDDSDYLAEFFSNGSENELVSFDLEDSAMSFVAHSEHKEDRFTYHQQEALWNKIFASYVGGYEALEEYVVKYMDKGRITF